VKATDGPDCRVSGFEILAGGRKNLLDLREIAAGMFKGEGGGEVLQVRGGVNPAAILIERWEYEGTLSGETNSR